MSRPNLIEELGRSYFTERFNKSMFFTEDKLPAIVTGATSEGVKADVYTGTPGKASVEARTISPAFFKDMSVFFAPSLGWRHAANGRYLAYFSRNNRSYARGVTLSNLNVSLSATTLYLVNNQNISQSYYERSSVRTLLIMQPEFTPLTQGIKDMRDGKIVSFAASHNIAVIPDSEDEFRIMFNLNPVGRVLSNGNIECRVPIVEKVIKEVM